MAVYNYYSKESKSTLFKSLIYNRLSTNQIKSNVGFWWEGKTGVPGGKPLIAEYRTNKLNPRMTPSAKIEPGPHWWKASALTTRPTLPPRTIQHQKKKKQNATKQQQQQKRSSHPTENQLQWKWENCLLNCRYWQKWGQSDAHWFRQMPLSVPLPFCQPQISSRTTNKNKYYESH